jgi:hypothetical protein
MSAFKKRGVNDDQKREGDAAEKAGYYQCS